MVLTDLQSRKILKRWSTTSAKSSTLWKIWWTSQSSATFKISFIMGMHQPFDPQKGRPHFFRAFRIHWLMGEERFRRWITQSCDKSFSTEEERWLQLIAFLEKEIKVCQHMMASSMKANYRCSDQSDDNSDRDRNSNHNRNRDYDRNNDRDNSNSSHHTEESQPQNSTCCICGETDHVATTGPSGIKIIQYFSCKKFVEMLCVERFEELKNNLCGQCLYPGTCKNQGKHKEGRCHRDFACKHESHERC